MTLVDYRLMHNTLIGYTTQKISHFHSINKKTYVQYTQSINVILGSQ